MREKIAEGYNLGGASLFAQGDTQVRGRICSNYISFVF